MDTITTSKIRGETLIETLLKHYDSGDESNAYKWYVEEKET